MQVLHTFRLQHSRARTPSSARLEAGTVCKTEPPLHLRNADDRDSRRCDPELHHYHHHHHQPARNPAVNPGYSHLVWSRKPTLLHPPPDEPNLTWASHTGPPIIQHPSRNLGRPRSPHVLLGQHVCLGTPRPRHWLRRAPPPLRPPSPLPVRRLQLPQHRDHFVAHWLARHWHQLCYNLLLPRSLLVPILPAALQARVVPQVQLCFMRGLGWRHAGRRVYYDVCAVWRQWEAGRIPELLGEQWRGEY